MAGCLGTAYRLQNLFAPSTLPISDRLISAPIEPTADDLRIWERVHDKTLSEARLGRYWTFVFNDKRVLEKLVAGRNTLYHRSLSNEVGGRAPEEPLMRFFSKKSDWEFDVIFLGYIYGKRSDGLALSGTVYYDLQLNEEPPMVSCCGNNSENTISWKGA